jgi:hypothetical protein
VPGAPSAIEQLRASWVIRPLLDLGARLDERGVAIAGGVIALCVVLAWFDHRRSRDRPLPVVGLAIAVSAIAWSEAALRVSCGAWLTTFSGAGAAAALLGFFLGSRPRGGRGAA